MEKYDWIMRMDLKDLFRERSRLRKQWFDLDRERREGKLKGEEKEKLMLAIKEIDSMMIAIDNRIPLQRMMKETDKADSFMSSGESVFERQNTYTGPTTHGHSIGDGCYWNRRGHS